MDLIEGDIHDPINHWYYAHKFKMLYRSIEGDLPSTKSLIDVGAGSAIFSKTIQEFHPHLKVLAIDTGYKFIKRKDSKGNITYLKSGAGVSGELYFFTDVLEHVQDDSAMLADYVSRAPFGSKFVVTVPAFMSLWSGHDVFLKHFRRYKKAEINKVVELAGLKVVESQYLYAPLFPIVWIARKLPMSKKLSSQLKNHGIIINRVLLFFLKIDFLIARISPFGVSIIILAKKPRN